VLVADLAFVLPATIVIYAAAPSLWTAAAALVAVGAAYIGVLSGLMTVVQVRVSDDLRARVLSLYMVSLGVIYPIGAVIQGKLGDEFGLRAVVIACAALFAGIMVLILGTRAQRRNLLQERGSPHTEAPPSVPAAFA
jgi:predicted MFS family arabinose efflux permease